MALCGIHNKRRTREEEENELTGSLYGESYFGSVVQTGPEVSLASFHSLSA